MHAENKLMKHIDFETGVHEMFQEMVFLLFSFLFSLFLLIFCPGARNLLNRYGTVEFGSSSDLHLLNTPVVIFLFRLYSTNQLYTSDKSPPPPLTHTYTEP